MYQITIDTGGTFTDAVLADGKQGINVAKSPTDSSHPEAGIMKCIALLAQERKLTEPQLLANVETLIVGTTLPTNILLEGKGAKCGLFYTNGFRDIFELGNTVVGKINIYNAKVPPPTALIPRSLRWGVEERTIYTGEIITPLNEDDVRKGIKEAKKQGVEVPVVCYLYSYVNPENEERTAEIIKTEYPNVVMSSNILRRRIEFDRLTAAALAAYVKPGVMNFATGLQKRLKDSNFSGAFLFVTRLGGVASPDLVEDNPALLIGSGPAAAILLGPFLAEAAGFQNIIVCDMGGTSFDVSVLPERRITTTTAGIVGEWKNPIDGLEPKSLGGGGGSIARVDDGGTLRVGPSGAGANPGPACYGKGGKLPTVTDASMILGYYPAAFLGGKMPLYPDRAQKAVQDNIARKLNVSVTEAAYNILSIAEDNMADSISLSAVEKGFNPQEFTLVVGGGAFPVHAVAVAAKLNMKEVYIPRHAAFFSALGIMVADYKHVLTLFLGLTGDAATVSSLKSVYDSLEEQGAAILKREKVSEKSWRFIRSAEMRYQGQRNYIDVLLPETRRGEGFTKEQRQALIDGFHERHKAIYGRSDTAYPVRVETVKLQAIGVRPAFKMVQQSLSGQNASGAQKPKRKAYFHKMGGFVETSCYDGGLLRYGNVIKGPAIIDDANTTVVVPPETELTVDVYGNYRIKL